MVGWRVRSVGPGLSGDWIDLRITAVSNNTTYYPWVLNPSTNEDYSVRSTAATTGDNVLDNVEQVVVSTAQTNEVYLVEITHKGTLTTGTQPVSIFISGNVVETKPTLSLRSPTIISNSLALQWPSVVGQLYSVEYKADLNATNWTTEVQINAALTNVTYLTTLNATNKFYRLREVEQ